MMNTINETEKEYIGHKPHEWAYIPVGYHETEEHELFYEYVIATEYGLKKVICTPKNKILGNEELALKDIPF